jgi:hypothetical protein
MKVSNSLTALTLLATALLLGNTSAASAQQADGPRFSIQPRAGIAIPAGDLSDVADAGPSFGIGLQYQLTNRLALRLDGDADVLSGVDASGSGPEGPDVTIYHYGAGLQYALLAPGVNRWAIDVNLGAGASTFDVDEFSVGGGPVDFSETYFTANGGLQVGYAVTPSVNVFGRGQAYLMFTDEDDTAVFNAINSDVDPAGFDSAWTIPLSVGVAIRF